MRAWMRWITTGACLLGLAACTTAAPLEVVPTLDLKRYAGTWYEISRLPFSRQEGCVSTTATYTLRDDGDIDVVNRCVDARDGTERVARGKAWIVEPPAKLEVRFFWPFSGDYWVIDLGERYEYAVVGMPSRKYMWILSREPTLPQQTYDAIVARAAARGFDVSRLLKTEHR